MRKPGDIKNGLLHLRFKVGLPMTKIAEDAGCSVKQVIQGMQLEASETIQRRLDAYLDAGQLHKATPETKRALSIERLSNELWKVWNLRTLPMRDVMLMSPDRQERLRNAMHWRLKRALRAYVKEKTGTEPRFPDSKNYWQCKAAVAAKIGLVAP